MKIRLTILSFSVTLLLINQASAILISGFGTSDSVSAAVFNDTWVGSLSETATISTIGNPATDFGDFIFIEAVPDLTGLDSIAISAMLDTGNTATGFSVTIYTSISDTATAAFTASDFNSGSFTTVTEQWVISGSFDPTNVIGWGIGGGSPSSTTTFRMSFDNVEATVIPEPSTMTLLFLGAYALIFGRRKR